MKYFDFNTCIAGQERFQTITQNYYNGAMGVMLVYDITNSKSFDNLENWLRRIKEHGKANVEKMILGNKCDLEDKRLISKVTKESLGKKKIKVYEFS